MSIKNILLISAFLMAGTSIQYSFAGVRGNITMQIIEEGEIYEESTKVPHTPIVITQNGYALHLPTLAEDFVLQLLNENGVVVYSTLVPVGTTQVVLPTTLSGTYEIRLVAATYYYMGYIVL